MELIGIIYGNFEQKHTCYAISNNKDIQVIIRRAWLKGRFDKGLILLKCNVRGKCFTECTPAEYAWAPIEADGCMYISCLWASGQSKGLGYSVLLPDERIRDSKEKGKKGSIILPLRKKMGYFSNPEYLKCKGSETADAAGPYFELMYLALDRNTDKPRFRHTVRNREDMPKGLVLYYTSQCPFTAKYVPLLEKTARKGNVELQAMHIQTRGDAQNASAPFTTFSLFRDGELLAHEIPLEKKFDKLISQADSG